MNLDALVWEGRTQKDLDNTPQIVSGFNVNPCNPEIQEFVVGAAQPLPKRLWVEVVEDGRIICVKADQLHEPLKYISVTELYGALHKIKESSSHDRAMIQYLFDLNRPESLVFLYRRKDS